MRIVYLFMSFVSVCQNLSEKKLRVMPSPKPKIKPVLAIAREKNVYPWEIKKTNCVDNQ